MAKFKQKEFAIPIGAIVPVLKGIGTVASKAYKPLAKVGKSLFGKGKIAAKTSVNNAKSFVKNPIASTKTGINNKITQFKTNPGKATLSTVGGALNTAGMVDAGMSLIPSKAVQKSYSISRIFKTVGKEGKALLKTGKTMANTHKTFLVGSTLMGAGMGVGSYGVNKIIESDKKKSALQPQYAQKSYSIMSLAKKGASLASSAGKTTLTAAKKHKVMIAGSMAMGALPAGLSYVAEKSNQKDQINSTAYPIQTEYSLGSVMKNMSTFGKSILNTAKTAVSTTKSSAKKKWGNFKKKPGTSILDGVSKIVDGGGYQGVAKFGHRAKRAGEKHGSVIAQKLGDAIIKNPKLAVAASIPVGVGIGIGTFDAGNKLVRSGMEKLDKNAYAYENSLGQQIS